VLDSSPIVDEDDTFIRNVGINNLTSLRKIPKDQETEY